MDGTRPDALESSVSECEALLHALSDELAGPDGGDLAATLLDALVRKGGALRGVCIAHGNASLSKVAEALESCVAQMAASPSDALARIGGVREKLEELRRASQVAAPKAPLERINDTRWVAIVEVGEEAVAVPLDAIAGAHPESSSGMRIEVGANFGGGIVHARRLFGFASVSRTVVDGAGVWPATVTGGDGTEARVIESAAEANSGGSVVSEAA